MDTSRLACAPSPDFFPSFWSSKSLVLLHYVCGFCQFVYDGWVALGDLSGSIDQGNRENPQDPNGRSCFFKRFALQIYSFVPNWQGQQTQSAKCYLVALMWLMSRYLLWDEIEELQILPLSPDIWFWKDRQYGELLSNSSSKKWAVRGVPGPVTSSAYYSLQTLWKSSLRGPLTCATSIHRSPPCW